MRVVLIGLQLGCAISVLVASPAFAQTDDTKEQTAEDADVIIVTAEKRDENLMTSSLAASVLNSDAIRDRGVRDITDLVSQTPGLTITGGVNIANIRGIGLAVNSPVTSSGVTTYIDGSIVFHEQQLVYPSFDVARFEVLRGPQGTVSGSNSTGGSILIVSPEPRFDGFHGTVEQRVENYSHFRTDVAINLPVSDTLAFRLAAVHDSTDGYWHQLNPNLASRPGSASQFGARLSMLYQPGDSFKALIHAEYGAYNGDAGLSGPAVPTRYSSVWNDPLTPHDPFNLYYSIETFNIANVKRVNAKLTYGISDSLAISSFSSWTDYKQRSSDEGDYGPPPAANNLQAGGFYNDTIQQEFNLVSTGNGPVNFILGAYYLKDVVQNDVIFFVGGTPAFSDLTHQVARDTATFGQVTYDVTPKIQFLLGGRYTHNSRLQDNGQGAILAKFDWNVVTAKFGVNFKASENHFFYAFAAKGGKAGGFNFDASEFGPETDWDYELGWKGYLLDRHVQMQVNGYYMNYKGFQISGTRSSSDVVAEIFDSEGATIKGIEATLESNIHGLQINGSLSYTDSSFKPQMLGDPRFPANPLVNITGFRLPFSAEWQFNAGAAYDIPMNGGGDKLTPRVQVSYLGNQWVSAFHVTGRDFIPGRTLVDASLTYRSEKGWSVAFYGQNILDETYLTFISTSASRPRENYGAPATYGIRGTFEF